MFKKLTFTLLMMAIMFTMLFAVSESNFVLNVTQEKYPVREFDNQVAIDFDSEYELLLKNNNERDCTARIWIDGSLVSQLGDFIVYAGDELNLERFVSESMQEGKRFKFVPLDNPEVDDPSREENGIVKVGFRLEKEREVFIVPSFEFDDIKLPWYYYTDPDSMSFYLPFRGSTSINTEGNMLMDSYGNITTSSNFVNSTSAGATIGGGKSNQSFSYRDIDIEDQCVILTLKIVGINKVKKGE